MKPPPLVIVGPTATGKSSLAIDLAHSVGNCQIISADAMAVYRGMDIGTAKVPTEERRAIPHHLVDVIEPSEDFDMATFAEMVDTAIGGVEAVGETPIIVGGTGLYVRAVVDGFSAPGRYPDIAAELERIDDTAALHARLCELDPAAAAKMQPSNRRRVVRALEVTLGSGRPFSSFGPGVDTYPATRFCQIGLEIERSEMDRRIDARFDRQMEAGFLAEVASLPDSVSRTAGQALGYRELRRHLDGEIDLAEAVDEAKRRTRRFARRQQRWFRRDPRINWLDARSPDLLREAAEIWIGGGDRRGEVKRSEP